MGAALDLAAYAAAPQVLITISDERTPSLVDAALAEHGLSRRIAVRTRFFLSAALLVAETDLLLTCPLQLARYAAARLPVRVVAPPLALPCFQEFMSWHPRFDADPGLQWLRGIVRRAAEDAVAER